MSNSYLDQFRKLEISRKELSDKLGKNLLAAKVENPVVISNTDVINLLNAFRHGRVTLSQLLEWVNTVWFTELFTYDDECCDAIASVLDKLEDLDENHRELTEAEIERYVEALLNNCEI